MGGFCGLGWGFEDAKIIQKRLQTNHQRTTSKSIRI